MRFAPDQLEPPIVQAPMGGGTSTPALVAAVSEAGGLGFLATTSAPTALIRAFTGRTARGIVNGFMRAHGGDAPPGYPDVHHVTAPLRAAAARVP